MSQATSELPAIEGTPTARAIPLRAGGFGTLTQALDHAAEAGTGINFFDSRGRLASSLTWGDVRDEAQRLAAHLAGLGLPRGAHVAIIAETHPDFAISFFACRYAALTPVPLAATVHLGGHQHYVNLLRRLIVASRARVCLGSADYTRFIDQATADLELAFTGHRGALAERDPADLPDPAEGDELAYIQFTSGSTRFPRGAMMTETATRNNVTAIIRDGLVINEQDRFCSWLPLYHDMGLVGKLIVPMASQTSIDYLGTREFAMRPRQWLRTLDQQRGTISFSPPFGYELTARRLRAGDAQQFDLSCWRIAGCGADMIRPGILENFAEALAPAGFDPGALTPSYGMAEVSLAVSFTPLGRGVRLHELQTAASTGAHAHASNAADARPHAFVGCGRPLPGYSVQIRDEDGSELGAGEVGTVFLSTPSTMLGYLDSDEVNREVLRDGWLDTGDLGCVIDGEIVITGRRKDLMIVNGRNIWPQDIEHAAEAHGALRPGDAAAFAVSDGDDGDRLVLLVQCREQDDDARAQLMRDIRAELQAEFGIEVQVTAVPPHSLARTTSGKLSRSQAKQDYLAGRLAWS